MSLRTHLTCSYLCACGVLHGFDRVPVSHSPLQTSEVLSLLLEPPADSISTLPPVNPKGGEIYIYHSKAEEKGMTIGGVARGFSVIHF